MPTFDNDRIVVTTSEAQPVVLAQSTNNTPQAGPGIMGKSAAVGVWGESTTWHGVAGITTSTTGGFGVWGKGVGPGVGGISDTWVGVYGESNGAANGPAGLWGEGKNGAFGVKGHTSAPGCAGVGGFHMTNQGPGILGIGNPAGRFEGDVEVTGDIRLLNADCAEEFDVVDVADAEPGTVMVLDDNGELRRSTQPYDRRVAGVVSGGGAYRPAIILDRQEENQNRRALALIGKVYCKVDAAYGAIGIGDLLTTSPTPGHAMRAEGAAQAFGAVIGKAMRAHEAGTGMIPVLVALQ